MNAGYYRASRVSTHSALAIQFFGISIYLYHLFTTGFILDLGIYYLSQLIRTFSSTWTLKPGPSQLNSARWKLSRHAKLIKFIIFFSFYTSPLFGFFFSLLPLKPGKQANKRKHKKWRSSKYFRIWNSKG